ncbi:MAG: glycosyltransferase [Oscillochloris sp.]|nr:glycosyltransferase [Oscillochloris sp.]
MMKPKLQQLGTQIPVLITFGYALDRTLRLLALRDFFRRPLPPDPPTWPAVTLIQPVSRSSHDLRRALVSRACLDYSGPQQHLLVCDQDDVISQAVVRELMAAHPGWPAELITVVPHTGLVALKLAKIAAALPQATGEVLVFVDDDVCLPPNALRTLLPYLWLPDAGASFGLARYEAWESPWSSLMSLFVNAGALPSYVPLSYLTKPYTITGHCFALCREVFDQAGGFSKMEERLDDDHELARRVRAIGLHCVQTPLIYGVENRLATARAYHVQLRRWFTFPRLMMLPQLSTRERWATLLGSLGNLLPPLAAIVALIRRKRGSSLAAVVCLGLCLLCYAIVDQAYLGNVTPARRWPLLIVTVLLTPLHVLAVSLGGDVVEWRGQRIRVLAGGRFEVLERS